MGLEAPRAGGARMIGGLEAIHAWTPPGEEAAAVELGRVYDARGTLVWPRYELRVITGLGSLGDPEDNRDRPPGQAREIARLSERRGKTVVYEGPIKAQTLKELREAEADLRAAFADEETEGRMDVSWHPLDTQWEGVPAKFYEARALTVDIVDKQEGQRWVRWFVVSVRLSDGRYFDEETERHEVSFRETGETAELS